MPTALKIALFLIPAGVWLLFFLKKEYKPETRQVRLISLGLLAGMGVLAALFTGLAATG